METQIISEEKGANGEAIGSMLIGIVSIFGLFLVGHGSILSIAGILIGLKALRETKRLSQKGRNLAVLGIILNCLGIASLLFNYIF